MKFSNANALNFNYILLEFYKYLNLTEDEVMVILMINHLLSQGNELINSEILSLKMNMSNDEIDNVLSKLFTKGYIEFITKDDKLYTSIDKIKSILVKCFEKSVFTDEELKENEELDQIRKEVFSIFQKEFKKHLNTNRDYKENSTKYLQRRVSRPGVLLEVGFLSNSSERALLTSETYQNKLADVIRKGVNQYFSE